jgi:dihydroflavonol-4-reductase
MNIIPVEDVALGHILAAEKGNVGDRYILGNENMRLRQILDILEEGVGRKMPRFRIPSSVALLTAVIAESLANNILGQKPVASLEGVRIANARMVFDCTKARRELGLPTGSTRNAIVAAAKELLEKEVHPKTLNAIHKKNPEILIQ